MADFFEFTLGNILGTIISVSAIILLGWQLIKFQKSQAEIRTEAANQLKEAEAKRLKEYTEEVAKRVKQEFETAVGTVVSRLDDVDAKVATQLKRQSRRSDFTNSNVRKVRNDALDTQLVLHTIEKALLAKGIIETNNADMTFKREIERKRQEIAADEKEQTPDDEE